MRVYKSTNTGFTLLELLIAIAVFAVLAIMSYGTLSSVLLSQTQTREAAQQLARVQQAVLHIERDLLQIVVRPIRDYSHVDPIPALMGAEFGIERLEFTRTGRANPNIAPRSYLQRITYAMPDDEEHKLYRYVWPSLDRSQGQEPRRYLLLDDVEELVLRFYDDKGEEHNSWPPPLLAGTGNITVMPQAIKVVLKLKSMGEIWRLLAIPGA